MIVESIRRAAAPLLPVLPVAAWLPHGLVRRDNGKLDKPPRCGSTSSDPSTWFTLDGALAKLTGHNDVAGVGFAITDGIIGLDFDDCRDPTTGVLTDEVQFELERINSYAYITPSGKGIRIVGTKAASTPMVPGKYFRFFPSGYRVEIFVGPTNFYNTFTAEVLPGYETVRDISGDTLDYIASLDGGKEPGDKSPTSNPDPQRGIEAIRAALRQIPNNRQNWDEWCRIGMAAWRSSGGSIEGHEAWRDWSAKNPCHDDNACDERWKHWFISPPTKLGFGTLYHEARQANPLFVPPFDEVHETRQDDRTSADKPDKGGSPDIFQTLDIAGLMALPPVQWLIDGILTTDGFSITYGPPGSLKTFLVLDQALHICSGRPWNGRAVKSGKVLYVAGEGVRGIARRIKAWCIKHDVDPSTLPFRLLPASINLSQEPDVKKLIRTAIAQMEDDGECVALVVVDTVARSIPGLDENSAQEMGLFVAAVEDIKTGVSCHLLGVHHSGKDETRGARGSNALLGAVDTMIRCKREKERLTVTIEKQKDEDEGEPIQLRTTLVEWMNGLKPDKSLVLLADGVAPPPKLDEAASQLRQVALLLGTDGRMVISHVATALGLSGRKKQEFVASIPLAPDYTTVSVANDKAPVRLALTRRGGGATSPVEVVRYDSI